MASGIYKILCLGNGRIYIGSAKNIAKRWNRHLSDLRNSRHDNIHIQRSFDKYGESKFIFDIIEECSEEDLFIREQYYLDTIRPYEGGFNIGKDACGGDNLTYNPEREEIIERMSNALKSKLMLMSDEERSQKWGRFGEENPNFGRKWSDESRKSASESRKGKSPINKGKSNLDFYGEERSADISRKISLSASKRIGDKNPFYGKHHTEESKNKSRQKMLGSIPSNRIKIEIDGIFYESYHHASIALGIPVVTIRWRCHSKNSKFDNYKLV